MSRAGEKISDALGKLALKHYLESAEATVLFERQRTKARGARDETLCLFLLTVLSPKSNQSRIASFNKFHHSQRENAYAPNASIGSLSSRDVGLFRGRRRMQEGRESRDTSKQLGYSG
jgi:hypothetical protein